MKFITFKRQSKLIQNRASKLLVHAKTIEELPEINERHKQQALSLYEELKDKTKEYNTIRDKLLNTPNALDDESETELEEIESNLSEIFLDINTTLRPLLPTSNDDSLNMSSDSSQTHDPQLMNVRLPKIQLKPFNGDISQWVVFHNIFDVTINKNKSLTDIEKFQYLLSCLQNEPLNLIKALPITSDNYKIAYETLMKRYHNPRVLKSLHINHLIDMPNCYEINATNLRHFIALFREHSSALRSLDINTVEDNPVLLTLLLRKFDVKLRTRFEGKRTNVNDLPTPEEFINFLENECAYLENAHLINSEAVNVRSNTQASFNSNKSKTGQPRAKNVTLTAQHVVNNCTYCNGNHLIYSCSEFLKFSPKERLNFIKANNYCVNCLGSHKYKECASKNTCRKCSKRHHTLLHLFTNPSNAQNSVCDKITNDTPRGPCPATSSGRGGLAPPRPSSAANTPADSVGLQHPVHSACTVSTNNETFTTVLGTVLLKISSLNGASMTVRALIDSASSCSFVNTDVVNKLQLKRQFCQNIIKVDGISATSVNTKGIAHVDIFTLNNQEVAQQLSVVILDKITSDLPSVCLSPKVRNSLTNFRLADPSFDKRGPIQMLLGADIFMKIIKSAHFSLGENMPYILDTVFGFVIIGKAPVAINESVQMSVNCTTLVCLQSDPLHKLMSDFWSLEQPPEANKFTEDELACENHFLKTHTRCPVTGKYTVRLPFQEDPAILGDSSLSAKRRFYSLENRLNSQPELKGLYCEFMDDYLGVGHMTLLEEDFFRENCYFLPHHGVIKESSTSTRLRVVFDASCKTTNSISLNDVLHTGPKLHNDIASIIINFRQHRFVFTTDIKQMFRSIDIDKSDRKYQLIYWRKDPSEPLSVYQLNTVTYGMACSPFLANRVIKQLIEDEKQSFTMACEALKKHIYIDDIALGADTLEGAINLKNDVISLLKRGGFELRKWTANDDRLLSDIPPDFLEKPINFHAPDEPLIVILGFQWIPNTDRFTYKINVGELKHPTKRTVLSHIARIFDPCGFLSPIVIFAKLFIQILWTRGINWDTMLPHDLAERWLKFYRELPLLEKLSLPRYFSVPNIHNAQLHGFCDSSEAAYAACVYLRLTDAQGNVKISLVIAKTRVAPLKRTSLPRLELCSAHLLAKLMNYSLNTLNRQINIDSVHTWTDSTVALAWISTPHYKLRTFVANRVAQIQEWLPGVAWSHVPSASNPADCASRGILPHQLLNLKLWWTGPQWLILSPDKWPKIAGPKTDIKDLPEVKVSSDYLGLLSRPINTEENNIFTRYSSWEKLRRIIALLLRFINNMKNPGNKSTGLLTFSEIECATLTICRMVQKDAFTIDIENLKKNKSCSSHIQCLSPFIDKDGLLRVGGRLKNAQISSKFKYPVLLPKSHFISTLIVDYYHVYYLHAGPQFLQSHISKYFWILSSRSLIRSRIHKCLTCFKFKPRTVFPKMGDLPEPRVNPSPCFSTTGLDYGGPFDVKVHTLRRAQVVKAYLCLFVCFATKAVHIEVALDLTTDTFLAALTRFVARRGAPSDMYMDNATNFVGASNQINKLVRNLMRNEETKHKLNELSVQLSTKFHFIPPSAPHQGGLWESGIKSAKTLLKRVIGERILTLEEFQTLSTRVEAILNSRPLCPLSTDPSELDVLTPGHFLIGRPMISLPEPTFEQTPISHLRRWQVVQSMVQHLWRRWQVEYLHTLQQRGKWTKTFPNLEENDLVLIHDNTSPPQTWIRGRVIKTHPGADGITRVVTLRTPNGTLTRPVVKVSPLPK